jgi:dTDP-4-amino-4,6-dideoxygalactose transaminase
MNELEMFQKDTYITSKNVSKEIYDSCISIPSSAGLTKKEMNKVVSKIKEFYEKY